MTSDLQQVDFYFARISYTAIMIPFTLHTKVPIPSFPPRTSRITDGRFESTGSARGDERTGTSLVKKRRPVTRSQWKVGHAASSAEVRF